MRFELSYMCTPALAKQAYWQLIWRLQRNYVIGTLLIAAVGTYGLWTGDFGRSGAFLLGGVTLYWYLWWSAYDQTGDLATQNQHLRLLVTVDEQGVTVATDEATTTFSWVAVSDVHRLGVGLVISRRAGGTGALIPAEEVSPALIEFIEHRSREVGAHMR